MLLARLTAVGERADVALLQACAAMPPLPGDGPKVAAAAAALLRLSSLRTQGRTADLAPALTAAAELLGSHELAAAAQELTARAQAAADRLAGARARSAAGDSSRPAPSWCGIVGGRCEEARNWRRSNAAA
jgi:hypothetical protein